MAETTKTQSRTFDNGRQVRVVTGWNYTHYNFWFVVYVQLPGGREIHVPAADAIDDDEQTAFDRGFEIGAEARV